MVDASNRTEIGNLIYQAKTYKGFRDTPKPGDPEKARQLSELMAERYCAHPRVCSADWIVGVPANPRKEPNNLPELLAKEIARRSGVALGEGLLEKVCPTGEMKKGGDEAKLAEMVEAFRVVGEVEGQTVFWSMTC